MIRNMITDRKIDDIAGRFHATLVEMALSVAEKVGLEKIVLSGGVFQNIWLLQNISNKLKKVGFQVFTHQQFPPNDGGIAVGQIMIAAHQKDKWKRITNN